MNIGSLPAIMKLDKALVERAVMNVVGNGFDYSPQGGTLYVDVKSKDTGGAKVILKIPC